jgi:hypothetical protein
MLKFVLPIQLILPSDYALKLMCFFNIFCPKDFGPGRRQFLATPLMVIVLQLLLLDLG